MAIKEAKVRFMRLGVHALGCSQSLPKAIYFPSLEISYMEKGRKKGSFTLDQNMVTKKNYRGTATAEKFVVVWASNNYLIYSESGEHLTTLDDEIGRLVSVSEACFCVAKDKMLFAYNEKGNIVGQRELTEDELKELGM